MVHCTEGQICSRLLLRCQLRPETTVMSWYYRSNRLSLPVGVDQGSKYHKMSLSKLEMNRHGLERNTDAAGCEDTALLNTRPGTLVGVVGAGDEAVLASDQSLSVCTTALQGGGTISHYNTHIPFHDFMPAHPCHKHQCSQQEQWGRKKEKLFYGHDTKITDWH